MVKDGWRRNNQVNAPPLPVHLSSYLSPPFRVLDLHHHLLHPNIRDPRRCHQKHRPNPLPLHLFDDRLHVDGTAVWRKFSQVVYPRPFLLAVTLHVYADELCFRGVKGSQFVYICVALPARGFRFGISHPLRVLDDFAADSRTLRLIHDLTLGKSTFTSSKNKPKDLETSRSVFSSRTIFRRNLSNQIKKKHIYIISASPLYLNKGVLFFESESDLSSTAATRLGKPSKDLA
jgi:hypothetical protein